MDVTEAPPPQVVATLPEQVAAALPGAMVSRLAANVELARRASVAERDLAAVLGMAHRYQSAMLRLDVDNRALRALVAELEAARVGRVRRWWRGLSGAQDGPCVCLAVPRRSL